jgi:hypothetical protein
MEMEKENKKSPWAAMSAKDLQALAEDQVRRSQQTVQIIQTVYDTEAGRDFLRWLIVETRMFALSLGIIENLHTRYNMSSDYYTGQMDLAKKVLEFLTPKQVADLVSAIVKENVEKKGKRNVGSDKVA